jgi:hypothetical protein
MKASPKYSLVILVALSCVFLLLRGKKRPLPEPASKRQSGPSAISPKALPGNPPSPISTPKPGSVRSGSGLFSNKPWEKAQYEVLKNAHAGVVSVRRGGKEVYALVSQISVYRCESDKEVCVRFPDGQKVIASPELLKRIPPMLVEVAGKPWYHRTGP